MTDIPETERQRPNLQKEYPKLKLLHKYLSEHKNEHMSLLCMLEFANEFANEFAGLIEKAKKDWEGTFDAISDPIFLHDKDLKIVRANLAYIKAAGLSFEEILGRLYYEVFPKMEKPFLSCSKVLKPHEAEVEELNLPAIDKTYLLKFFPLNDAEGNYRYSVHILEDITEIRRAEEKLKEEMKITSNLLSIAEATNDTTDITRLMEKVVQCVSKITQSEVCLSYLWNTEVGVFQPNRSYGLATEMLPLYIATPLEESMDFVKTALDCKELILFQTKEETQHSKLAVFEKFNSMSVMVLNGKTGHLGLLISLYNEPRLFSVRDRKIATGIIQTVSLALEEAELYRLSIEKTMELANKIETIQVMHEIDLMILSTLTPDLLLESVVLNITKIIPCDSAKIALIDKLSEVFTYDAGFGLKALPKGATVAFKETSATEVVKTGRSQYVANLKRVTLLLPFEKKLLEEGFMSHIRVALKIKGEIIGVLSLGSKRPAAFTATDLTTLENIASQISVALENSRLVTDLLQLFLGTVKALSSAIDAKSRWTAGHSERVARYALNIARASGFSKEELNGIELAALLHDIGKIATHEVILNKPSSLTDKEIASVRLHPVKGREMLSSIKQLLVVLPVVEFHHEAYNGRGYPVGLKGEEIPFHARILAVADSFDAMKADRPYRSGLSMEFIAEEFKRCSGTQFDPEITRLFLNLLESEPLNFSD